MQILVTILHIIVCVILIVVVLLQAGKGASMGAAFGGSSQTIFGSSGPTTFLGRMTTVVAVVFMLTSLCLSYFALQRGSTVVERHTVPGKNAPFSNRALPPMPVKPATSPAQQPAAPTAPQIPAAPSK